VFLSAGRPYHRVGGGRKTTGTRWCALKLKKEEKSERARQLEVSHDVGTRGVTVFGQAPASGCAGAGGRSELKKVVFLRSSKKRFDEPRELGEVQRKGARYVCPDK